MKKNGVVTRIHDARRGHKQWVSFAEALLEGIPLDQEKVPITPVDCQFGQWYYGEGRGLADLAVYQQLEAPHDAIHQTYQKIFAILFEESRPSVLARLFGSTASLQSEQKERARALLPQLQEYSNQIIRLLDELENEVRAMSDQEIERRMG